MDLLKWKRQSSSQSLQGLVLDSPMTSSSPAGSSPASSINENSLRNSGFFTTVKRSLSRASTSPPSGFADTSSPGTPGSPGRKVLHKQRGSFSSFDSMQRRSSVTSEGYSRVSRTYSMSFSSTRSSTIGIDWKTAIDWKTQQVEAHCPVEADPQVLRSKPTYMVVTQDYIVKMKSKADALSTFPQIGSGPGKDNNSVVPPPEPLLVIPIHMVVSVFFAESSRPSFGIELWWKSSSSRAAYISTQVFFSLPQERADQMGKIVQQLKAKNTEFPDASLVPLEVEAQIVKIFTEEEPGFKTCKPEIFPVVRRSSVRDDTHSTKMDKTRKAQDGASWYLAVGRNMCYLAEAGPGFPVDVKYQTFGLVNLSSFRAKWNLHEERFVLSFREPFKPAVTLELASRYYRQIVITFMKADRFLKPCWPTTLQTVEVFRISGLADPQLLIAGDNYGGLKRTLDAFLSAYRCLPVEWEINWRTAFSPEFRLLPPKAGNTYTNLQLLAVMRSLRYNGYFNSISFNGIDLSTLWDKYDFHGKTTLPYMNRSCLALSDVELGPVRFGSLLHQELHALAFCSETIRQIDLTDCFVESSVRREMAASGKWPAFLFPILNLLELGLTKCNHLLLSGNFLRAPDVEALIEALMTQQVDIQTLDISHCGLSDLALRDIFEVLFHQGYSLQYLDVSGNRGRVHASVIANLSDVIMDLRRLNVSGVLMGDISGPLFSFETLLRFENLEELDLSNYKVNDATLYALESFLSQKPLPLEPHDQSQPDSRKQTPANPASRLRKIALNNCGINGREAARLVRTLGHHTSAHLHISGNPLEDGIDDLCRAISMTPGPVGLHMDMVEFRDETNFVALMKALMANKNISFLSMAGTAPTPSANAPCPPEVCEALEEFFANNKSVRYLDLSGYSGKLDEGQLGKGSARSLRGLASNDTLTHLRIRNQDLHEDVGTLGEVIRQNSKLRMVDCRDNNWNLTSVQFLAKSLKLNKTIIEFPFEQTEYDRVWKRVVTDVRRQNISKTAMATQREQENVLRDALQKQVQALKDTVQRNRLALELNSPFAIGFDDSPDTCGETGWPSLELKMPNNNQSSLPPNLSATNQKLLQVTPSPSRLLDLDLDSDLMTTPVDAQVRDKQKEMRVHKVPSVVPMTVRSDAVEADADLTAPYHVGRDEAMLETPPSASSLNDDDAGWASPTTSGILDSPMTPRTPPSGLGLPDGSGVMEKESRTPSPPRYSGMNVSRDSPQMVPVFDMGTYFSGQNFVGSRYRIGGLEAHMEE
ncbi:NACHT, LRR and PYD domains-containing protein 12 [Cytospora mali]|uniref:NACHT, LRR and PYD domains-containing protein 12 n=1 Tax=Cytospora mali TaxID=578113 RepID=A0A194V7G5_CYTMA|nr:NACHT, LRR and PYD domains-containing protein 12 [Valsa mali var. pyri (nom. inval.)]